MRSCSLVLSLIVGALVVASAQGEEKLGRLIVKVTEAGTHKPVAGATVRTFTSSLELPAEPDPVTGADGCCEVPVPLGNLRINTPSPPPGYWIVRPPLGQMPYEQVALTRQQPTIERGFEMTPAVLWPARAVFRSGGPVAGLRLHVASNSFRNQGHGGTGVTDAAGHASVTLPREGGDLWVSCRHDKQPMEFTSRRVQLDVASGFDHTQVASAGPASEGDRFLLVDRQGRKASCAGCRGEVQDGVARLLFEVQNPPGPEFAGEVAGRIVDEAGQPVQGATVLCHAAAMTAEEYTKQTDERGEFRFRSLFKWSPPGDKPAFGLWITKDGFARLEVSHFFTPNAEGMVRLEPLALKPAWSVPVRVLDVDGHPVEGAWVTSQHGDRFGHRTNRDGSCTVRNLPTGTARIGVSYGDQAGSAQMEVTPAAAAGAAIVIQLKKGISNPNAILSANAARPRLAPLPIGAAAPEWSVAEWTDGKQHSLADLRGKIVVIEFWDYSCSPCREITLPVSNILQAKYKDVAFVHINPAGSQPHLTKELLALERWNFVVGFDKGTSGTDSETLKAYGVSGFSTIVILDRQGRVLENDANHGDKEQEEAKSKAIAAAAGLPWPIDKDASQEEVIRRFRRFHEHLMTQQIEKALATAQ